MKKHWAIFVEIVSAAGNFASSTPLPPPLAHTPNLLLIISKFNNTFVIGALSQHRETSIAKKLHDTWKFLCLQRWFLYLVDKRNYTEKASFKS